MHANPNTGYNFVNWTENGTEVSVLADYPFSVNGGRSLVAHYSAINYAVGVTGTPLAGGSPTGAGTYAAGTQITVHANPNSGYSFVNWTENGTVVSTLADYPFTVNGARTLVAHYSICQVPSAPGLVQASQGTYSDRVYVSWSSVSGVTSYLVYRNPSNSFGGAQLLGEVSGTSYNDYSAAAPTTVSSGGCGGGSTTTYQYYYYWVVAKNSCGNSSPGGPAQGWRGSAKALTTFEKVLPSVMSADGLQVTSLDGPIAVRLTAADVIDPATVWGVVQANQFESSAVVWVPIDSEIGNDGWVVFYPAAPWAPGYMITMEVGGATVSGETLGPVSYTFEARDAIDLALLREEKGLLGEAVWQPTETGESPVSGAGDSPVSLQALGTVPDVGALPLPVGPAYAIGPDQVYEQAREVWIPLPEGVAASDVQLFYLKTSGDDAGWYEAENVLGWLTPDGYLETQADGVTYLGFSVRHGGIVQLGLAISQFTTAPASAGMSSNFVTFAVTLLALLGVTGLQALRRKRKHTSMKQG